MSYESIPLELRKLRQWVTVGPSKAPLTPRTGRLAKVTDPSTWGTFDEAVRTGRGIGFVLSAADPYCFIDLDKPETPDQQARHSRIYEAFESYTELSQSGNGVHIVCRATIPRGARRDRVEVYDRDRYMICTGHVLRQLPIVDQQELVDVLVREMGAMAAGVELVDTDDTMDDEAVLHMANNAENAAKFAALWDGNWEQHWPSQSEADFALLSMLAFYSTSNEQVRRLFRRSALGLRDKAQRDAYLNTALRKVRAKQPPPVDYTAALLAAKKPKPAPPKPKHKAKAAGLVLPPGLVGDVARYIEASAVRPVPEIALAAAIALVAGIAGRSYNISGTGLNQYVIAIAPTGSGKEGGAAGIDSLINAVRRTVPAADLFLGPAAFASGQALVRCLDRSPCFVSVLGEFGLTLQNICDPRSNESQRTYKRVLLDLYTKSGADSVLRPSVYSDSEKNTRLVQSPAVTLFGEGTPTTFYDALDSSHVAEGLIPRFLVVEYSGPRPPRNAAAKQPPSEALVEALVALCTVALSTQQNNTCAPVQTDSAALAVLDAMDKHADRKINSSAGEAERQIWNRAHLKALKLAALVAVGVDPHDPTITEPVARWAVEFVQADCQRLEDKFAHGAVGTGESRQEHDLRGAVLDYGKASPAMRKGYGVPDGLAKEGDVVPYCYIRRRLRPLVAFRTDKRGASAALRALLDDMSSAGVLVRVPAPEVQKRFGVSQPVYVRGASW